MTRTLNPISFPAIALLLTITHSLTAFGQTGSREYQEPHAKSGQITWSTEAGGQQYVTTLKISRLAETPKWADDKENPPLSARKAIKSAIQLMGKLEPYGKNTKLKSPTLKLRESNGRWFWVVYFSPNDFRQFQSTFPIVVMMDGSTVTPVKGRETGFGGGLQKNKKRGK